MLTENSRLCPECRRLFEATRSNQKYCSDKDCVILRASNARRANRSHRAAYSRSYYHSRSHSRLQKAIQKMMTQFEQQQVTPIEPTMNLSTLSKDVPAAAANEYEVENVVSAGPKRRAELFQAAYVQTVEGLRRAALVFVVMDDQGDDLSMFSAQQKHWFRRIAAQQLLPEFFLSMEGIGRQRLANAPVAVQRAVVDGKKFRVYKEGGGYTYCSVPDMTPSQVRQVFDHDGTYRTEGQQMAHLPCKMSGGRRTVGEDTGSEDEETSNENGGSPLEDDATYHVAGDGLIVFRSGRISWDVLEDIMAQRAREVAKVGSTAAKKKAKKKSS